MNYFQSPSGPGHAFSFIKARSALGLRRAMLQNNTKHKAFIVYSDIQWVESEKSWYAWYVLSEEQNLSELASQKPSE